MATEFITKSTKCFNNAQLHDEQQVAIVWAPSSPTPSSPTLGLFLVHSAESGRCTNRYIRIYFEGEKGLKMVEELIRLLPKVRANVIEDQRTDKNLIDSRTGKIYKAIHSFRYPVSNEEMSFQIKLEEGTELEWDKVGLLAYADWLRDHDAEKWADDITELFG